MRQRAEGVTRRLMLLDIRGDALCLHDEPIWQEGRRVGLTTSGARGVRTGKTLAFGLIDVEPGEMRGDTCQREFRLEVAGQFYPARALAAPPFDPEGRRMRE